MPIGFDRGDTGSVRTPSTPARPPGYDPTPEMVRLVTEDLEAIRIEQWATAEDERVCPECGPLDGLLWEEATGPYPPLHNHCRCTRVLHHFVYQRSDQ